MSLTSAIAIFFVIWWVVLFAVLPWGVRSHHEAGLTDQFTDAGAPLRPRLVLKAAVTTLITALLFAAFYIIYEYRLITLDSIPILREY